MQGFGRGWGQREMGVASGPMMSLLWTPGTSAIVPLSPLCPALDTAHGEGSHNMAAGELAGARPENGSRSLATSSIFPPTGFRAFSSNRSTVAFTLHRVSNLSNWSTAWPGGEKKSEIGEQEGRSSPIKMCFLSVLFCHMVHLRGFLFRTLTILRTSFLSISNLS